MVHITNCSRGLEIGSVLIIAEDLNPTFQYDVTGHPGINYIYGRKELFNQFNPYNPSHCN